MATQLHPQWCGSASRGASSPLLLCHIPASPRFEDQTPGLGPYLPDVGTGWHWVFDAVDGEDDVRQSVDGVTVNHVLSEKEGERSLAQQNLPCLESPRVSLGMTRHLATVGLLGINDLLDVEDHVMWADQQRGSGVKNGLTATITSNNLPVHGDAERQGDKASSRITLGAPVTTALSLAISRTVLLHMLASCFPLL